jgi:hypothetical protein
LAYAHRRVTGGRALLETSAPDVPLLASPEQQLLLPPPPPADGAAVSRLLDSIMPSSSNSNVKPPQSMAQRSVQALLMSANAMPLSPAQKSDVKLRGAAPLASPAKSLAVSAPLPGEESMQLVRSDEVGAASGRPASVARLNTVGADELSQALQVSACQSCTWLLSPLMSLLLLFADAR